MTGILFIPRSNVLRFVRTDNYNSVKRTYENTLLCDWGLFQTGMTVTKYYQKFSTSDPILIQFISDYTTNTVKLYNSLGVLVTDYSSLLTVALDFDDGSDKVAYNLLIDTATLGGKYYFEIGASAYGYTTLEYTSEWIEVNDFSTLPYITWQDSDDDGIIWRGTEIFGFRINALLNKIPFAVDKNVYMGFQRELINAKSRTKRLMDFIVDPCPLFVAEKLVLALDHKTNTINDVLYQALEEPSIKPIDKTNLVDFSAKLQEVVYENNTSLVTVGEQVTNDDIVSFDGTNQVLASTAKIVSVTKNGTGSTVGENDLRTSGLTTDLDKQRLNYYALVDNPLDGSVSKIALDKIIPYQLLLVDIGTWNMQANLTHNVSVDLTGVVAFMVLSLIDDDGIIVESGSIFDAIFHNVLQTKDTVERVLETSSSNSTGGAHTHQYDEYGLNFTYHNIAGGKKVRYVNGVLHTLESNGEYYTGDVDDPKVNLVASNVLDFDAGYYSPTGACAAVYVVNDYDKPYISTNNGNSFFRRENVPDGNYTSCAVLGVDQFIAFTSSGGPAAIFYVLTGQYSYTPSFTVTGCFSEKYRVDGNLTVYARGASRVDRYTSGDNGETWTSTTLLNNSQETVIDVCCSETLVPGFYYIITTELNGYGKIYPTGGATTIFNDHENPLNCVACSKDGHRIIVAGEYGVYYYSKDYGKTFTEYAIDDEIKCIHSNSNGSYSIALSDTYMYVDQNTYSSDDVSGNYEGLNITVGAKQTSSSNIELRHNYPGSWSEIGTTMTNIGQLDKFNGSSNRGKILLFKTITA